MGIISDRYAPFSAEQLSAAEKAEPKDRAARITACVADPKTHALVYAILEKCRALEAAEKIVDEDTFLAAIKIVHADAENALREPEVIKEEQSRSLKDRTMAMLSRGAGCFWGSEEEKAAEFDQPLANLKATEAGK